MTEMAFSRTFHARKEYKCDGCPETIKKGEQYDRFAFPAWLDYEADVDDDGRQIAILRSPEERRWHTMRFHMGCYYG